MPEASPDLNVRPRLAVKAGIGGFHPAVKQLAGKACNGVPLPNGAFHWEPCKKDSQIGGGSIPDRTQKRSINFPKETLEALDKLAAKKHTTTSELVREYVDKGLSIEGSREDIDFIARLIRQEITAIYHVDEIKAIADHDADRLAKMLMKIGKINGAVFFLLIKVLMNLAGGGREDEFDRMLSESVKLGVAYMQKKDFQINSFLHDTGSLREQADKL